MTDTFRKLCAQPEPTVDDILLLAAIIREVDGGNRLGAAQLAEDILNHPASRWGRPTPQPPADGDVGELVAALRSRDRWTQLTDAQTDRARKAPLNLVTWQAIKTAPRDGRFFIGANTNEAIVCNWPKQKNVDYAPGKWRKSQGEWNGSIICTNSPLTHWQALPTLPVALPTPEVTND